MAAPILIKNPAFLVFPTLTPVFTWRVVATETNRTISRHKNLELAISRAIRLNQQAAKPVLLQCQYEYPESRWGACDGMPCGEEATVYDQESEMEFCLAHFEEVRRGL